ncbi:MAG: flagellar export protein FliJ [bacterium]|nr:flagellar export protein FliJ [bacterium]
MPRRKPFRYGALLRVRTHEQDRKARDLAEVRREIARVEEDRDRIVAAQRDAIGEAAEAAREEFRADDVRRYFAYERQLARLAVDRDSALAKLRRDEDERRTELEEAMKRKRIVERLKERQDKAFADEMLKEDRKAVDEIATNRAAFKVRPVPAASGSQPSRQSQ